MQELITNFQRKHGKKVPLPKLYMDEDSSDSESLELADGTRVGRKTPDGAGGSSGGKPGKKPSTGGSSSGGTGGLSGDGSASTSGGGGIGGSGAMTQAGAESMAEMTMTRTMIPVRGGRPANLPSHQNTRWQGRSHGRANQRMVFNTSAQEFDRV